MILGLFLAALLQTQAVGFSWDVVSCPATCVAPDCTCVDVGFNMYCADTTVPLSQSPAFKLNPSVLAQATDMAPYIANLPAGKSYNCGVSTINLATSVESGLSNIVRVVSTVLAAPTGLAAKCSADAKSVTLSWDPVVGAQSYYLRVDNTPISLVDFVDTQTTQPITPSVNYDWWVYAYSTAAGFGPLTPSNFVCKTPPPVIVSVKERGIYDVFSNSLRLTSSTGTYFTIDARDTIGVIGGELLVDNFMVGTILSDPSTMPPKFQVHWFVSKVPFGMHTFALRIWNGAGVSTSKQWKMFR